MSEQQQQRVLFDTCCCTICLEIFEDPRMLHRCGHTYCWNCILQLSKHYPSTSVNIPSNNNNNNDNERGNEKGGEAERISNGMIICPQCRVATTLQPEPLKNYVVNSFCEMLRSPPTSNSSNSSTVVSNSSSAEQLQLQLPRCDECNATSSSKYCEICNNYYCDECFLTSHKAKTLQRHSSISVEERVKKENEEKRTKLKFQIKCKQHRSKDLKVWCEECNEVICKDCALIQHKLHTIKFADEAAEFVLQNEIPQYITNLKDQIQEREENLVNLTQLYQHNDDYSKQTIKLVNDEFDQIVEVIIKTKKSLMTSLKNFSSQTLNYLQSLISSETYRCNDLNSILKIANLSLRPVSSLSSQSPPCDALHDPISVLLLRANLHSKLISLTLDQQINTNDDKGESGNGEVDMRKINREGSETAFKIQIDEYRDTTSSFRSQFFAFISQSSSSSSSKKKKKKKKNKSKINNSSLSLPLPLLFNRLVNQVNFPLETKNENGNEITIPIEFITITTQTITTTTDDRIQSECVNCNGSGAYHVRI